MVSSLSPRNRGCNSGVRFELARFTEQLFALLGSQGQFSGPGPVALDWLSLDTSRTERFAIDYLAKEMFSKFDDGVKSSAKRERAIARFNDAETLCALTNCKFSPLPGGQTPAWLEEPDLLADGFSPEDSAVFRRAQRLIGRLLGAFPGWDAVLAKADFGPGATTRLSRVKAHRSNKWGGTPHVTQTMSTPLASLFEAYPLIHQRFESGVEIVAGNNVDWVPKNYKTDRTIAIEPDLNMFFQKGLGGLLRAKLRRVGQDLDDQSNNRFLAAIGSIDGSLATLDMSMASDTVAYRLVEFLIRPDWFEALEQCRSQVGFYTLEEGDSREARAIVYEKFSSMGNGFTFELETLIFWGILRAVSELTDEADHRLYVYGDDVVVPSGIAEIAMTYLEKAGFIVNQEKSFWSGSFRESCGGHYVSGVDVTPFYVREPVDTLDRLFLLHNNVYRWFNRFPGIVPPEKVAEFLGWIRSHAPEIWQRPRLLTEDVGDGAFIGSFDQVCPSPVGRGFKTRGWEGWRVQTLQYRAKHVSPKRSENRDSRGRREAFPEGSGPDLASLWQLERTSSQRCREVPTAFPSLWLAGISSRDDIDRVVGKKNSPPDVPHTERWWFVANQVLPFVPGSSWW